MRAPVVYLSTFSSFLAFSGFFSSFSLSSHEVPRQKETPPPPFLCSNAKTQVIAKNITRTILIVRYFHVFHVTLAAS